MEIALIPESGLQWYWLHWSNQTIWSPQMYFQQWKRIALFWRQLGAVDYKYNSLLSVEEWERGELSNWFVENKSLSLSSNLKLEVFSHHITIQSEISVPYFRFQIKMTSVEKLCLQWSEFQVNIVIWMFPTKSPSLPIFQKQNTSKLFFVVCPS